MRAAVLILAHKNVCQLEKLVQRLSRDFDVYIHADAKWDIDLTSFGQYENVFFVKKRHSVNWGSYIQILATIELFRTASQMDYDYYLLISGHDLPIKSNAYIKDFINRHLDVSFVNSELMPKKEWAGQGGGFDRLVYYFGIDFKNNFLGILRRKALSFTQRMQLKYGFKRKLYPIRYYGGWNWVNLNRAAMQYLLKFIKDNPSFLKSFRYTYCADEIWLQTVLLNSPLDIRNENLRFTSWEEHASHPKILLKSDLEALRSSDGLFARKFDADTDEEIINIVYQMTDSNAV